MASPPTMNEEEELATLIYKTSKTAKARAAAAAKGKSRTNASSLVRRTAARKRSFANQDDGASTGPPRKKRSVDNAAKVRSEHGRNEAVKKKHGYECSAAGCTTKARRKGGVCVRHGAKLKLCSSEGCTNQAKTGGVCRRHGAKRKQCGSEGCTNIALKSGLCTKHGATVKRCSSEGCDNKVVQGGVCVRHGAKVKFCSHEGCTNQAKRGGVCKRHGANRTPNDASTAFGTELDGTWAPPSLPNLRNSTALPHERSASVPTEVLVTQEIVEV